MGKFYKPFVALLTLVFLGISGMFQQSLDRQRRDPQLGLTQLAVLNNAPPMLAFTTVALGSFRGLIANVLWIRAAQLQDEGKFFEMVQLSDWISKLEPHIAQVWTHQAWNMAYNISVRFSSPIDRWRWVRRGIELLRDEGLRYNPKDALIYQQLGFFFQHKIGYFLDDAHNYYKAAWYGEMNDLMGPSATNLTLLVNPPNEDMKRRGDIFKSYYKLEPALMQEVESKYGKMEWRLPESHAIYWGFVGLKNCEDNPANHEHLVELRRLIYQSLHSLVLRGKVTSFTQDGRVQTGPDLDLIPIVNAGYLEMIATEKTSRRSGIETAYRNFLREAVYQLYVNNRSRDAEKWFAELKRLYPTFVEGATSVEEYSLKRLKEVIEERSFQRLVPILIGFLKSSISSEAIDQDDDALRYQFLARNLYDNYQRAYGGVDRVKLDDWSGLETQALREMLDPKTGLYPELAARVMKKRNIPSYESLISTNTLNQTSIDRLGTNRVRAVDLPIAKPPGGK